MRLPWVCGRSLWLWSTAVVLGFVLPMAAGGLRAASIYPPDSTLTNLQPPSVPRPAYLAPIIEPAFGTQITRVSDQQVMGLSAYTRIAQYYSLNQPWNSDGSLILLSYSSPSPLLDGTTYRFLRNVSVPFYPLWSHSDPKKLYGTYAGSSAQRNKLVSCNIDTCNVNSPSTLTIVHDFGADGYDFVSIGEQEGNLSNDDRFVPIQAKKGSNEFLIIFDIVNNRISATKSNGTTFADNFTVSQSGKYVIVDWANGSGAGRGTELYDINFNFIRTIYPSSTHYDLGYDVSGNEVFVGASFFDPGKILIARRLDGGGDYTLTDDNPGWRSPGHVSCRNIKRPGWCYISDDGTLTNILGYDQTAAVRIDNSKTFERFAFEHHTSDPSQCYECDAMAVPSPDGAKVMFASEWGSGSAGPIYAYVAEMPGLTLPRPPTNPRILP